MKGGEEKLFQDFITEQTSNVEIGDILLSKLRRSFPNLCKCNSIAELIDKCTVDVLCEIENLIEIVTGVAVGFPLFLLPTIFMC